MEQKTKKKKKKQEISEIRRRNAKLYPIYKMFSWDLLFYYSIEFLFLTITKRLTATDVLIVNACYLMFKILGQMPAVMMSEFFGKRKTIALGNAMLSIYLVILMFSKGIVSVIIANIFCGFGFVFKQNTETNLLYDSVSTKGGEGLYSQLDARGNSMYYLLDGIAAISAGYLFVINNYLPFIICLVFTIISTIIALGFKDIYEPSKEAGKSDKVFATIREFRSDLKECRNFIFKSKRMKAFILFQVVFYSLIKVTETYRNQVLTDLHVPEEQFSMIFAALGLISAVSLTCKKSIEKKFKNRTLKIISLMYIGACIVVGILTIITTSKAVIPLVLMMYAAMKTSSSIWWVLEAKYLKNFTTERMRSKITFVYNFIGSIAASICSVLGGLLLKVVNVEGAFLMIGLLSLACMVVVLDYMRKRIGLRPKEYKKEDIEY